MIQIRHLHEKPASSDGERIYIDRLWADGAYTKFVKISVWNKDLAPSYDLWRFHYDPQNWDHFTRLYKEELTKPGQQVALQQLSEKAKEETLTLVYGNGDAAHNCAIVLKEMIEKK